MKLEITKSRVLVSRLFALTVLLLAAVTTHSFAQDGLTDVLFEVSGLALLTVATLGRLWALLYVAGNKRERLVTEGPYSMVRHPLYVSSLIGACGLGLASENVLVLAAVVLFYFLYYPPTIRAEEAKLVDKFGEEYIRYTERVPAFIPRRSAHAEAGHYRVSTAEFVRHFGDAMWFVWMFLVFHLFEALQMWGVLPVLWKVP